MTIVHAPITPQVMTTPRITMITPRIIVPVLTLTMNVVITIIQISTIMTILTKVLLFTILILNTQ